MCAAALSLKRTEHTNLGLWLTPFLTCLSLGDLFLFVTVGVVFNDARWGFLENEDDDLLCGGI